MKKYKLGNIEFNTKTEVKEYIRNLLSNYEENQTVIESDFKFVYDLLNMHEDFERKIGCGVDKFYVAIDRIRKPTKHFKLVRKDGSETDFSWVKCLGNIKNSKLNDFKKACRWSVKDQIIQFRNKNMFQNKVKHERGYLIQKEDAHVDHVLSFNEIVDSFIKTKNIKIDKVIFNKEDNSTITMFLDKKLENDFQKYHEEVCVLRIITKKENLTLPKK